MCQGYESSAASLGSTPVCCSLLDVIPLLAQPSPISFSVLLSHKGINKKHFFSGLMKSSFCRGVEPYLTPGTKNEDKTKVWPSVFVILC